MSDEPAEFEDLDERLYAMQEKGSEAVQTCQYRSATRIAGEMRRLAKSEQRVIPYMDAGFTIMNHAADLLEPESARDRAIELISLLESEDRARAIEPDLPEAEYAETCAWMTACAYDNLAKATAHLNGYNSDGMHQCIGEGILVCRRTGKLQCITCFREYATDVYKAADDLDMAVHFARVGIEHQDGPHDRRWIGAKDLAQLLILRGDANGAVETIERAWELIETYHTPLHAGLQARLIQRELSYLLGRDLPDAPQDLEEPPAGEFPWYELARDRADAVGACVGGDYAKAIELLQKWDRVLTERNNLDEWLGHRLRLLCVHRMAGNERELKRLSEPLVEKAQRARDWLTLRCLKRILDPSIAPTPVPMVDNLQTGTSPQPAAAEEPSSSEPTPASPGRSEPTERVQQFWMRLAQVGQVSEDEREGAVDAILSEVLAIKAASVADDDEARWLIHTARHILGDGSRGRAVWQWAESLAAPRMRDATMLSLLATLGAALRFGPNEELAELISTERLETMFRESLDLDPSAPRNFGRAGSYFMFQEDLGEAERCYARGSRLDRADANLALGLADVYSQTDRMRDALAVLDMCLREGCQEPEVLWKALLTAFQLEQYEAALTYIDRHEELAPEHPWVNYYRAASLLELERPAEALAAAEEEGRRNPDCPFTSLTLSASALGALKRTDEFRRRLTQVLRTRLAEVDYLSRMGLCHLFRRLWLSAHSLPPEDPLRLQLENHLLSAALAPNELFEGPRKSAAAVPGMNFYEVLVQQPLDGNWPASTGCLAGEEEWASYLIPWGVLASDEEEAAQRALSWQARCFPLPAEVLEVNQGGEDYTDSPGVVWQGFREGESSEA